MLLLFEAFAFGARHWHRRAPSPRAGRSSSSPATQAARSATARASQVLSEILKERADAIAEIHASTLLLNNIARDLAGEVDAQQAHVDQLEEHTVRTHAVVQRGGAQLREARQTQGGGCAVS